MSMLDLTKEELDKHQALNPALNPHIQRIVTAIPYTTVDPRMKATIAVSQLMVFASQFRRNIQLWDDTLVPINTLSFVITGSGGGKDSSVKAARKCFSKGYTHIEEVRNAIAKDQAIADASAAGEDPADQVDIYSAYLPPVPPIDIMPTTGPGLIQHINDIGDLELSAGFLYTGELSDELAHNPDMMENIKILSEMYDLGDKEVKYTKGIEHRSRAVSGQPVSALLVGSPGHILFDEQTKKKFNIAFMSKLARRSWFCYTPDRIAEPVFDSNDEMIKHEDDIEKKAKQARDSMSEYVMDITRFGIETKGEPIAVDTEVSRLFKIYKRYNGDLVDSLPNQDSTYGLIRRHLQWKALKLAGALAIFDKSDTITLAHYVDAIRFCELLDKDMELFEQDLNKSRHERFSDFIRTQVQTDGKAVINIHDIKKQDYISTASKPKLHELITLAAGYDADGIYSLINDGGAIQYEPIIKTEVLGVSFKPINTTELNNATDSGDAERIRAAKHSISVNTVYGYEVTETTFADLTNLLEKDYAYSPFKFKNGVRGKDNILGGTKWIVFDIDESAISASETHLLLNDINHHIALSSNAANEYKFRVLIELDSPIELSPVAWKYFCQLIANDLALRIDPVPQSQIFFSYAGRPIMSITDAEPLEIRNYAMATRDYEAEKEHRTPKFSPAQKTSMLDDPLTTFDYCFEAENGTGSRSIIRMAYHAQELGATSDETIALLDEVMEYWQSPLEDKRYEAIQEQIKRMF